MVLAVLRAVQETIRVALAVPVVHLAAQGIGEAHQMALLLALPERLVVVVAVFQTPEECLPA